MDPKASTAAFARTRRCTISEPDPPPCLRYISRVFNKTGCLLITLRRVRVMCIPPRLSYLPFDWNTALLWRFNITCQYKTYLGIHVKARHFLLNFNQIWNCQQIFMKVPHIQIQENPSNVKHADTCGWTNRWND